MSCFGREVFRCLSTGAKLTGQWKAAIVIVLNQVECVVSLFPDGVFSCQATTLNEWGYKMEGKDRPLADEWCGRKEATMSLLLLSWWYNWKGNWKGIQLSNQQRWAGALKTSICHPAPYLITAINETEVTWITKVTKLVGSLTRTVTNSPVFYKYALSNHTVLNLKNKHQICWWDLSPWSLKL